MERGAVDTGRLTRKSNVVVSRFAWTVLIFTAWPLASQSTTSADESTSLQGGGPVLLSSPSVPKLPPGFFIQDATIFSSALSSPVPGFQENVPEFPSTGSWQTGVGFSIDAGWMKATPRSTVSIVSSSSLTEYESGERGRYWNEYMNVSAKQLISARLRSEVFTRLVITDQRQFLFGETQESSLTVSSPIAASNLLLDNRNVLFSAGGQVWYDYSPRVTLSLEVEAVRNQAIGPEGPGVLSSAFKSTSESATGTLTYALSRRSRVDLSLASSRTTSPLDTSIYASNTAAYVYALSDSWLTRLSAGVSVGGSSSDASLGANTLAVSNTSRAYPIGGASLEYRRGTDSLVISTNRGVTEVYGAGTGIVWSSNAAWNVAPPRMPWSFSIHTGYDLSESAIAEHVSGWRGDAGIGRSLSRSWRISCQYAFFLNSYRYGATAEDIHSHGLRLGLVWTPTGKGNL